MQHTISRNLSRFPGVKKSMGIGIALALFATVATMLFAWTIVSPSKALAVGSGIIETPTQTNPWGVAFDTSGHIWVAEPGCDASPMCGTAFPSYIGEYTLLNHTLVSNFLEPKGYSSPVFDVVDGSGNIWFTQPTTNAIGELTPSTSTWHQWKVPTASSIPYDLIMDKNGNIWFTEYSGNKIGFFNTSTHKFVENAIPTASCHPYGITRAKTGQIWFAENAVAKIGNFTPTTTGKVTLNEHTFDTTPNPPTPHLITSDGKGNIWYSEGFAGKIGEWTVKTGAHKDISVTTKSSNHISGISVDSKGRIWFDDSLNAIVGNYDPTTGKTKTLTLSNPNSHPHDGLAVDNNNNTWFTEVFTNTLGEVPAGTI